MTMVSVWCRLYEIIKIMLYSYNGRTSGSCLSLTHLGLKQKIEGNEANVRSGLASLGLVESGMR